MKKLLLSLLLVASTVGLFAQVTVSGAVTKNGAIPVIAHSVFIGDDGDTTDFIEVFTDVDGNYTGDYTIGGFGGDVRVWTFTPCDSVLQSEVHTVGLGGAGTFTTDFDCASCDAYFTFNVTDSLVDFTGTLPAGNGGVTWYFGDFSSPNVADTNEVSHIYAGNGEYSVCLLYNDTATGCSAEFCDIVSVNFIEPDTSCDASFTFSPLRPMEGDIVTFSFDSLSTDTTVVYSFIIDDSVFVSGPNATYVFNEGTFNLCAVIETATCIDTVCTVIVVSEDTVSGCSADFTYAIDSTGFVVTVQMNFVDTSASYSINFGDGSSKDTTSSAVHTYDSLGTYDICATVFTATCSDKVCQTITISDSTSSILDNEALLNVSIFPNPFTNVLTIEGLSATTNYVLTDVTGKVIVEGTLENNTISTEKINSGVYVLILSNEEGTATNRVIKQ
jgi:PKD repeat protein